MLSCGRMIVIGLSLLGLVHRPATGAASRPPAKPAAVAKGRLPQLPQPHHGLTALAQRNAWRPIEKFQREGAFLSERVIYTDTVTGCEVWQMTVDPGVDRVAYYDLPEWNADGSLLAFSTARAPERLWIMNADGIRLRPMPLDQSEGSPARQGYWSVRDPDIWWMTRSDDGGTQVVAANIRTGRSEVVARTKRPRMQMQPPHPREEHFLLSRQGRDQGKCEVIVLGRDGREQVVPIGGRVHRLRFTKADNLQIFFNRDDPRTQWVIMPDGSGRRQLPDAGVHPDWVAGGSELTYFFEGGVFAMTPEGQRRRVFRTGSGGHGGASADGRFFIADQGDGGDYPNTIVLATMDGSGRVVPVAYHGSRMWAHDAASRSHPDHHSTHPHPSFSPDGTKAVFSSYLDRAFTDLHVAVCRYPDPPQNLVVRQEEGRALLTWAKPERHAEIRGYLIFRSREGSRGFEAVGRTAVPITNWTDDSSAGPRTRYAVVAVEHSGLAGWPAMQAGVAELSPANQAFSPESPTKRPEIDKQAPAPLAGLSAKAVDPFHVELRWSAAADPDVQYYHVYALPAPNGAPSPATRIASPAEPIMVDWGRPPGSTQYYRVTAVDHFGNESTASEPVTVVMPALTMVNIELNPGDAVLGSGMEFIDSGVQEIGRVATAKPGSRSQDTILTWRCSIPIKGDYAVWVQQLAPDASADRAMWTRWADAPSQEWQMFGTFGRYTWWPVTSQPSSTPQRFSLDAVTTTLEIRLGGENVRLAKVLVTNDATRMPAEFAGPPVSLVQPLAPGSISRSGGTGSVSAPAPTGKPPNAFD
jgi:hypothetical protein